MIRTELCKSELRQKWLHSDLIKGIGKFDPKCLEVAKRLLENDIPPTPGDYTSVTAIVKAPVEDYHYCLILSAYIQEDYRSSFIAHAKKTLY